MNDWVADSALGEIRAYPHRAFTLPDAGLHERFDKSPVALQALFRECFDRIERNVLVETRLLHLLE